MSPANRIPAEVSQHGNLVIVNLQRTPLDSLAKIKINALCDTVMKMVMQKLGIETQPFRLVRYLKFERRDTPAQKQLLFMGVNDVGQPHSFLKDADIEGMAKIRGDRSVFQ